MREFKYNRALIKFYLWLSIAAAAILMFSFFLPERKIVVVLFIPMFLYFIYRNMTVLKTYDDRCEVRIAPFQGILKIEYKEILNVFEEKNLLVLLLDSGKKVKVSMSSFNSFERADVFNLFKNQCVR